MLGSSGSPLYATRWQLYVIDRSICTLVAFRAHSTGCAEVLRQCVRERASVTCESGVVDSPALKVTSLRNPVFRV